MPVGIVSFIGVYSTAGDPVILVAYAGEHVAGEPHPDGHESLEVRTFPLDAYTFAPAPDREPAPA